MSSRFIDFFKRVKQSTDIKNQLALASAINVNRSAVTQAKRRDAVPPKWVLSLSRKYGLNPDWLEFGIGQPRLAAPAHTGLAAWQGEGPAVGAERAFFSASHGSEALFRNDSLASGNFSFDDGFAESAARSAPFIEQALARRMFNRQATPGMLDAPDLPVEQIAFIPKVRARLCAGGGSFEVEAVPVSEHPFPRKWLARMGNPSSMVFMDVIGDSMAPAIHDGDMVLIDQSAVRISPHYVMAVGIEDTIYIKRVEQRRESILLHSDNPVYSSMEFSGDELNSFHVIGRVVWLCRDCR